MITQSPGQDTFGVFGTTAVLLVTEASLLPKAREIADAELAAVDQACNRFRPDSEIAMLNAADGATVRISELFAELIAAALRAARLTGGDVDPTCGQALTELGYDRDFAELKAAELKPAGLKAAGPTPGQPAGPAPGWPRVHLGQHPPRARLGHGAQLDLGATAKAWAADRCAQRIVSQLGCGALVSLGGDIAVAGPGPDGGWRVRVTDDHAAGPDAPGQTVAIRSGGLATSSTTVRAWNAGGRRVHHIINPATGGPADSCWRTVSVAAGSCVDANTASTAAIVRGAGAISWLSGSGLPARLVRTDGTVETTGGWPSDGGSAEAI